MRESTADIALSVFPIDWIGRRKHSSSALICTTTTTASESSCLFLATIGQTDRRTERKRDLLCSPQPLVGNRIIGHQPEPIRLHEEMARLIKLLILFGPVGDTIKVIKKFASPGQLIDESLMSTLCLPTIEILDHAEPPRFQTFIITKEDGSVLYGSGLIVHDNYCDKLASYCIAIITEFPFIRATKTLLHLVWDKKFDHSIIRAVMNIPLPARRRCLRVIPPHHIEDIYLYRGMADLPLLDYPLRELFSFLQIDDFLLAFACLLMEFRTLIISQDNYKLMMIGETLTSLLLPMKWCNVYVPILPPIYGATYLDAPTSYIMGINTQVTELPENLNHVQCRIYCDERESRVVCDADSLALPLFLNDIKKDIMETLAKFQAQHLSKPIGYLDDLKFNRAIRILFIKTIRQNILANYERYIVDVPESSSDIRQFDVVSYLSDQPEFMHSFLSKFLETQLFASFIDENAKRIQQSRLSIFDMDPDELSEHFTDKALEQAFQTAQRIPLMNFRDDQPANIEVKTVPASPMKLRRRLPALSSLASRLSFASKASRSTSMDQPDYSCNIPVTSSPPLHRNSVAQISLKGHLSLDANLNKSSPTHRNMEELSKLMEEGHINSTNNHAPTSLKVNAPLAAPVPSGKIIELINEVKDLSKQILIEQMGVTDLQSDPIPRFKNVKGDNGGALIGSLCDLIERVWAHGAFASQQDGSANCPLWNHLVAFARLKYLDSKTMRREFADGSHLNVLSPKSETIDLDMLIVQNSNPFKSFNGWFKSHKFEPMSRDLINDLSTILALKDVKTGVGKARAFIRLSLERKKLSKHLKTLIGDQILLNSLYKPYAFLRCEEEREQFLMYLLTLNAVDLPCFTTTFVNVINTRRMKANT